MLLLEGLCQKRHNQASKIRNMPLNLRVGHQFTEMGYGKEDQASFMYKALVLLTMSDKSRFDYGNVIDRLKKDGMNVGALAAHMHNLSDMKVSLLSGVSNNSQMSSILGIGDKWRKEPCKDGCYALVLKNPLEAFEMYAKEWETSFKVMADVIGQMKLEADGQVKNKIIALFNGLTNVDNAIRLAYLNAYITYASNACSEKFQDNKIKMDSKINQANASLTTFKLIIDLYKDEVENKIDDMIQEFMKLSREITELLKPEI